MNVTGSPIRIPSAATSPALGAPTSMYMSATVAGRASSSARLQVTGLRPDDAEVAVDGDAATGQERIRGAAQAVEAQEAVRLDALHDEPDLIEVGADHQHGAVLPAAPGGRDVAVAVDVHGIGHPVHALAEILDEGLLESGDAVEGDQIPQRLAERVLDRRRTIGHQEALYGPGHRTVKHSPVISVLVGLHNLA